MRSVGLAFLAAPWLAWGALRLLARASPRVRRRFLAVAALVLVTEFVLFGAGLRFLDARDEAIAFSIGGTLLWFPLLFVAAIRNAFVRVAALVILAAATLLTSLFGGACLLLFEDGGTFRLDDRHCATVEIMGGLTKGDVYDVAVELRWSWCPLLGVECASGRVKPASSAGREIRVVLVSDAGHKAASLRSGERELLRVPFE